MRTTTLLSMGLIICSLYRSIKNIIKKIEKGLQQPHLKSFWAHLKPKKRLLISFIMFIIDQ